MSQTLYAHFEDYSAFSVPEGIDLRDTKHICWYVRWNTLHIEHKDGRKWEIEATDDPQLKRPEYCTLGTAEGTEENIDFNDYFDSSSEDESTDSEDESDSQSSTQSH